MTKEHSSDQPAADVSLIQLEQASTLQSRVVASCLMTLLAIFVPAGLMLGATTPLRFSAELFWWLSTSIPLVVLNYIYAQFRFSDGLTQTNAGQYLTGYTVIWSLVGLVWTLNAIHQIDFSVDRTVIVGVAMVTMITVGGLMPTTPYRPAYISLASFALVPFSLYTIALGPVSTKVLGLGVLAYYIFCLIVSSRVQKSSNEAFEAVRLRALMDQILAQQTQIERAHVEKTRFLAMSSHDLAQPNNAAGMFISELVKLAKPGTTEAQLLEKLQVCWKSQRAIIEGLTQITRLESGSIQPRLQTTSVVQAVERVLLEFEADQQRLEFNKPALGSNSSTDSSLITSDPALLDRILRNLISNALNYSSKNSTVVLSCESVDNKLLFSVNNQGPAISDSEMARMFNEFYRGGSAKNPNHKGLGLGLAIVKNLTELLNIGLEVSSDEQQGTNFLLKFDKTMDQSVAKSDQQGEMQNEDENLLIAIIDREPAALNMLSVFLSSRGYHVVSGNTIEEVSAGLSRLGTPPDLALIDAESYCQNEQILASDVLRNMSVIVICKNNAAVPKCINTSATNKAQFVSRAELFDQFEQIKSQILNSSGDDAMMKQ